MPRSPRTPQDRSERAGTSTAILTPYGRSCRNSGAFESNRRPRYPSAIGLAPPAEPRDGVMRRADLTGAPLHSSVAPAWQAERRRLHPAQLVAVQCAQSRQNVVSSSGQHHPDRPAVAWIRHTLDESLALHPIKQLDHAVMAQLQSLSQLSYGRPLAARKALQRQQQLVLLRRQTMPTHGLLAEPQIPADTEAELGKRFEVFLREGCRFYVPGLCVHGHMTPRPPVHPSPAEAIGITIDGTVLDASCDCIVIRYSRRLGNGIRVGPTGTAGGVGHAQ
jgi:hypothetical protein